MDTHGLERRKRWAGRSGMGSVGHRRPAATPPRAPRRRGRPGSLGQLTLNQYLDRWLAHIQTVRRARTVARYRSLLAHPVRPYIGAQLLTTLQPLQVQGVYDQLGMGGRKDGKPGGLDPQHILAVHSCLHRALEQAVTWQVLPHNPAKHATPPPVPDKDIAALVPQQVDLLLDAAAQDSKPWLGAWTVLAAATGARNSELCGLEWSDLGLEAGTVRFRQELTNVDADLLPGGHGRDGHA